MRSRRNLRFFAGILAFAVLAPVWAQTDWEGTAAVGRYGEFPPGGLYVASNTFPLNSLIDVTNPATGRSARLIVVRETGDSGVFLLLSEAAASALGVSGEAATTVRAAPVQLPGLTSVDPNQDLPFHPDPDVNPSASLGDPNAAIVMPQSLQGDPAADVADASAEPTVEPPVVSPTESVAAAETAASDPGPEEESTLETTPEPQAEVDEEPETAPMVAGEAEMTPEPDVAPEPDVTPDPDATPEPEVASEAEPVESASVIEPADDPEPAAPQVAPPSLAIVITPDNSDVTNNAPTETSVEELAPETSIIASPPPDSIGGFGELPEVDLSGAIIVDVTDPLPESPNPVQVVVELPEVDDSTAPQVSEPVPERPPLAENEIALPIAPLEDLETEPSLVSPAEEPDESVASALPAPAEPGEAAVEAPPEREPLRPGLIPEDAIVSLEPAEFRSPDPPEPTVEDLVAETPAGEDPKEPENIAALSEEPDSPSSSADERAETTPVDPVSVEPQPAADPEPVVAEPSRVAEAPDVPETLETPAASVVGMTTGTADLPIVRDLDRNASWVQVAAFTNPQSVRRTIDTLGSGVPVAVLSQPSGDASLYRVYVGPLSEDEKGSMLYRVRSRGFRDAFVR